MALVLYLRNHTNEDNVYAFLTAQANGRVFFLRADGETLYYPSQPSAIGQPLQADCAIRLAQRGHTRIVRVPTFFVGGRIYFSVNSRLTFKLNPGALGAALVEPSVTNTADPNFDNRWAFCELTYQQRYVFANISYVDFVGIPISLTLYYPEAQRQGPAHVAGMGPAGIGKIAEALRAQERKDGRDWSFLIQHNRQGDLLRILSPNSALALRPSFLASYYADYVRLVWEHYRTTQLTIDTQASFGALGGRVQNGRLIIGNQSFGPPLTQDIFSCSTGPFATGSDPARNAIIPRLAAAFNRSTLLADANQPNGATVPEYYRYPVTNHYSRIVHETNLDHRGYAFPYDDVGPTGGRDVSGAVSGDPRLLIVTIGGHGAHLGPALINPDVRALAEEDVGREL